VPLSPRGGPSMGRPPRAALDLRAERERNQRQVDLAINVVLGVHRELVLVIGISGQSFALVVRMFPDLVDRLVDHRRDVDVAYEEQNGRLGVSPKLSS
jgi:hypothetical protein